MEKTKIIIGYSTNRDEKYIKQFNKHIHNTIGLKKDQHDILTCINNGNKSLTQVYNEIWELALKEDKNFILVLCHHDITFKTKGWGKNLLNIFNNNEIDILGIAGTDLLYNHGVWWLDGNNIFNTKDLWGKVFHTNGKQEWKTNFTTIHKVAQKIQPVITIDGVFMAINPENCIKFDEDFDNFHLYDISFCVENFINKKKIFVTETIPIVHKSGGKLSPEWEQNRLKLIKKYDGKFPLKVKK
jgi:hypothetical protein